MLRYSATGLHMVPKNLLMVGKLSGSKVNDKATMCIVNECKVKLKFIYVSATLWFKLAA